MTTPTSLADLFARAQAKVKADAEAKAAEKASKDLAALAKKRTLTTEELELRELSDWEPKALILVLDNWKCACGAEGISPGGLMIFSRHRRMHAERLASPRFESQIDQNLPRRHLNKERICALCWFCKTTNGFGQPHVSEAPSTGPALQDFAGEGAGFVRQWREFRAPLEDDDGEELEF